MAVGLTCRNAPRLLRTVNGKPHADDDHHEEPARSGKTLAEKEEDWAREPDSSSDSEPEKDACKPQSGSQFVVKTEKDTQVEDDGNSHGAIGKSKFPDSGMLSGTNSVGKRASDTWGEAKDPFINQVGRPAKKRKMIAPTTNIYAPQAKSRVTYGARKSGAAAAKAGVSSSAKTFGKAGRSNPTPPQQSDDDAELSEVSMESIPTPKKKKPTKAVRASPRKAKESPKKPGNGVSKVPLRRSPRGKGKQPISSNSSSKSEKPPPKLDLLAKLSEYGQLPPKPPNSSAGSSKDPNLDPNASGTSTPLSSLSANISLSDCEAEEESSSLNTTCPLCHSPIEPLHLQEFALAHPLMNMRDQHTFCRSHKQRSAEKEYTAKGYPQIDWPNFPTRLKPHYPRLLSILKNTTPSTYRSALALKVSKGDDRTLISTIGGADFAENGSTTGYYGSRGARVMMECITREFAETIREVAVHDPVVSFGGIGNFVQRVLVPELSLGLVMEDLGVGVEEAKGVVERSGGVGELVNEEVEDEVREREDSDEEEEEEE